MITNNQLREKFFEFFKSKGHTIKESASLIPHNDPSLLFNSAGMVPFKDMFLGKVKLDFTRAASIQKCVRTTDIENIGKTARHLTFFEMMGNFSFGDYFKKEAIEWAWEFLTSELELPKERLYATIYKDDNESFDIWQKIIGKDRIYRLGEDSNFWTIGETGPSGPCSEILFDKGEEFGCKKPDCKPGCDCDRYLEVWNLVFTEFDKQKDGTFKPLPKKNIDTGMGFERLLGVLQNVPSGFETDVFKPIWQELEKMVSDNPADICSANIRQDVSPSTQHAKQKALRIICDHTRSAVFLIADGVFPSNDGRGYVLKRLIRRAIRQGNKLGLYNFIEKIALKVIDTMKQAYPYLLDKQNICIETLNIAEKQFLETLANGEKIFNEIVEKTDKIIDGKDVFKLFDTYGMPVDLIQELAEEKGLAIDFVGYEKEMQEQKMRAKQNVEGWDSKDSRFENYPETEFVGYEKNKIETEILDFIDNGILLKTTPFYGESGGQKGDEGIIKNNDFEFIVENTKKLANGVVISFGKFTKGTAKKGDKVIAEINLENRNKTRKNHSATHILQAVLRKELGNHIEQAGSFVSKDGFRFDFTHPKAIDKNILRKIEIEVNRIIQQNLKVETKIMTIDEAKKTGALAFFGDKYGEKVRVVSICHSEHLCEESIEFCGGTHVNMTGEIGLFKITSEVSVASGVRRIEGKTGISAMEDFYEQEKSLQNNLEDQKIKNKELEKELAKLKSKFISSGVDDILQTKITKNNVDFIAYNAGNIDVQPMRGLCDNIKAKTKNTIVFLLAGEKGNYRAICTLTKDIVEKFSAKDILSEIAKNFEGSGGGKPDMAQGGMKTDKNPEEILEFGKRVFMEWKNK